MRAAEDAPLHVFLKDYCLSCHGAKKQEADLRLDQLSDLPAQLIARHLAEYERAKRR